MLYVIPRNFREIFQVNPHAKFVPEFKELTATAFYFVACMGDTDAGNYFYELRLERGERVARLRLIKEMKLVTPTTNKIKRSHRKWIEGEDKKIELAIEKYRDMCGAGTLELLEKIRKKIADYVEVEYDDEKGMALIANDQYDKYINRLLIMIRQNTLAELDKQRIQVEELSRKRVEQYKVVDKEAKETAEELEEDLDDDFLEDFDDIDG